ncbi:presequence protease 1, chloroplastic/mitochondrial-like [Rutidosis leptorrhynchoides]|uniref:presequence protease 1, chloroplastic/mitochondrial-like n=1 Tax=Rutidosis leptorrhynchoides TaxID=125765 RepID=UPI003A99929A
MAGAVLLRSITSRASHACVRSFYRSSHRLIPNFHRRSQLRHNISSALPSHIQFSSRFSHISPKSIATSPQYSTDAIGVNDEAAKKLGFEKVYELKMKQETPDQSQALKSVHSLSLHDIPKPIQIPIEVGEINGVKVLQHDLETEDFLYCDTVFDMSSLKQELIPLVPLFCQSLLKLGTEDLLSQLIRRHTYGTSIFPFTSSKRGSDTPVSHTPSVPN